MAEKTKILIVGYGNVGRGVNEAIKRNSDMSLVGIVSRDPGRVKEELGDSVPIYRGISTDTNNVDVAILCGGSKNDLPVQGPQFAKVFNTVDSFDTHKHISPYIDEKTQKQMPGYFAEMNDTARQTKHTSIISAGWDPGTFSVNRVLMDAYLPGTVQKAFYGLGDDGGLSMGHSDAVRQIKGVKNARQYTHTIPEAIERVRNGENPKLSDREMHWRECNVVLENDTDDERKRVEGEIKNMEKYFKPYDTVVHFLSPEQLKESDKGMFHDGLVLAVGETGNGNKAILEYKNVFQSNPEATGNILVACARACHRFNQEGKVGAYTMLDIAPAYLSARSQKELLSDFM